MWHRRSLPRQFRLHGVAVAVIGAVVSLVTPTLAAQRVSDGGRNEIFVGSELERYLRVLQVGGLGELYPWSIRVFSPAELNRLMPRDSAHPWEQHYALGPDSTKGARLALVSPRAALFYNSAFPFGQNDGAVWAGRGLTTAVQAGFSARFGPASLVVAPVLFRAENASFPLGQNGESGRLQYADVQYPRVIDLPQQFGNGAVTRLDPGQSTLRVDLPVITIGVSTANQHWGPAVEHPIVLGNNAPGFLHAFVGTSAPVAVGLGRVHGRIVWGRLEQSDYSFVRGTESSRFMSGLVAVFTPRGVPGLELGGARFFHTPWPEGGLSAGNFAKPFESLLKRTLRDRNTSDTSAVERKNDLDNQIASVFARWSFPRSGFEVYGEFGREDHNWDVRDLTLEPDHASAYTFGARKVWSLSKSHIVSVRGEAMNAQASHLLRLHQQLPFYTHAGARQGHTHRGQLLGSASAFGGAASTIAADYYHPGGRWSLAWGRAIRQERAGNGQDLFWTSDERDPAGLDGVQSFGAEGLFFRGRADVTVGVNGVYNSNRNFESSVFNVNAVLQVRVGL